MHSPTILNVTAALVFICIANTAHATLAGRLPATPGGTDYQAYYDDQLQITWAQNADTANGAQLWADTNSFLSSFSINGIGGWRLPSADVDGNGTIVNCGFASETECQDNEMGYMFSYDIGATQFTNPSVTGDPAVLALFPDLQFNFYWSGTLVDSNTAAHFNFNNGLDGQSSITFFNNALFVWAVYDGDVGAVPVPAALWLFGSGLLGLIGISRKTKAV
jgi:hypothetical protein